MTTYAAGERRRGLAVILLATLLMFGGFFMLVPLIAVHYVRDLHLAAAAVGVALGIRQLTQQGLTLFGGAMADRWGAKWLICGGMWVRAVGFAGLAWAHSFAALLALCVLAALGGALFDAPHSTAAAALTTATNRARFFSLMGVIGGLGMTLGPLAGAALLAASWSTVCFAAAGCFVVAGTLTAVLLPPLPVVARMPADGHRLALPARDRPFVALTVLLGGYWFLWVQLAISLPLAAQRFAPLVVATPLGRWQLGGGAAVYVVNAGVTIALQYPVLAVAERWLRPRRILLAGVLVMGVGLGLIALSTSMAGLLACVALFSLGAMVVQPVQQSLTVEMADPATVGSYFGFGALALAFGGGLGNVTGGWLYDLARQVDLPALPWLSFAIVGLVVAGGLGALDRASVRGAAGRAVGALPERAGKT